MVCLHQGRWSISPLRWQPIRTPPCCGAPGSFWVNMMVWRRGGAELLRCLRRLYRAQNRCEPGALRQLGCDCLGALESGVVESSAELLAAARALVRQASDQSGMTTP